LYIGLFDKGAGGQMAIGTGRYSWVQVARGRARINGHDMKAGDGAALSDEPSAQIEGIDASEVLVFDLA
jgi:hypothetical protein